MNYDEARAYVFMRMEGHLDDWGMAMESIIDNNNIMEGLATIKELTKCDNNTAKLIWVDLQCKYGGQVQTNNSKSYQVVNSCVPKCPTCGSTNIKSIYEIFSSWDPKQFKCNNCGYKW